MSPFKIVAGLLALGLLYLVHVSYALARTPPEAQKFSPTRWTQEEVRAAYEKTKKSRTDMKDHLPPKLGRRYVVVGGSGLVGGWIVQHLLWRGEDPSAIRILDVRPPTRPEIVENQVQYFKTDVTDPASVSKAFNQPWPDHAAKLPLTVFHTVAFIKASDRKRDFLPIYAAVNIDGTKNVLEAARSAGADCFIATSSGSIGVRKVNHFAAPWSLYPSNYFQLLPNAEPPSLDMELEDFTSCYAFTKAKAEKMVRRADSKADGFRTGCIRPGHAIYGYGVENPSSIAYDYLRRGGSPTWLSHIVSTFVDAQNVSLGHLVFEARLATPTPGAPDLGGRAYCVTDPSPPITYGDFYLLLKTLAHPAHPVRFPLIPGMPLLLLGHVLESYLLLRARYLPFLPAVEGDLAVVQPTLFNVSTVHLVYDDRRARDELGYRAPITTMEGLCCQLIDWNDKMERKLAEGKGAGEEKGGLEGAVPVVPAAVAR